MGETINGFSTSQGDDLNLSEFAQAGFAGVTNLTEQTEFRFAADYPAWATYTAQGVYSQTTISGTVHMPNGTDVLPNVLVYATTGSVTSCTGS